MSARRSLIAALLVPGIGLALAGVALSMSGSEPPLAEAFAPPGTDQWFGTDELGRSVARRTASAARVALFTAGLSSALTVAIGGVLGMVAGLRPGAIDRGLSFVADTLTSIPTVLLLIGLALALGAGWTTVPFAIAASQWPSVFRIVRSETMRLRHSDFVQASIAMGADTPHLIRAHLVPNLRPVLATSAAVLCAWAVNAEAILGYLGLGPEGMPSWGRMLAEAPSLLERGRWWIPLAAAFPLLCTALGVQLLADELGRGSRPDLD